MIRTSRNTVVRPITAPFLGTVPKLANSRATYTGQIMYWRQPWSPLLSNSMTKYTLGLTALRAAVVREASRMGSLRVDDTKNGQGSLERILA